MVTAFGLPVARPAVVLVSSLAGFAEKARLYGLPNVQVIGNPLNAEEFVRSFIEAHRMASYIRSHPDSPFIRSVVRRMTEYYDRCADSYYPGALDLLAQKTRKHNAPVFHPLRQAMRAL